MRAREFRNRDVFAADLVCFTLAPFFALALRLDSIALWESRHVLGILLYTGVSVPLKAFLFYKLGLYRRYWRYASTGDAWLIGQAVFLCMVALLAYVLAMHRFHLFPAFFIPRSIPIIDGFITVLFAGGVRFYIKDLHLRQTHSLQNVKDMTAVLIVGAGHAGSSLARELLSNRSSTMHPVGYIDDDREKQGCSILGLAVLGDRSRLPELIKKHRVGEVLIAMPTASGKTIRQIVEACAEAGVLSRTLPSIHEIASGRIQLRSLRPVKVEDLLRREPVETDLEAVRETVCGKRILVSGGGGSIGRELCRQLLDFAPAELMILGHGENSVFETVADLLERGQGGNGNAPHPTTLTPLIADVRSKRRIRHLLAQCRPEIVFHAAAHKHVPLMELHPCEAVTNNVIGTMNLLDAAVAADVSHFVLISTDKVVRPSSVMGATKRVAEYLVQHAAQETGSNYQTVRFGNVLGSRGSVLLTFQRQIARGGPITVTDPDVVRFFMTIPEAVQLVLQAAVLGSGGEVFVLDMGEPIRIVDLARDMIRLSGLREGRDIDIEITGLRPGEKMFEALFLDGESYDRSNHPKIFSVANAGDLVPQDLDHHIQTLIQAVQANDNTEILSRLSTLVPGFHHPSLAEAKPLPLAENQTTS